MDFLRRGELVNKGPSVGVGVDFLKVPQNPVSRSQVALKLHLKGCWRGAGWKGWRVGRWGVTLPFFFSVNL